MQKLWTPLATVFVERKNLKNFWWGFRPIWVTPWKEFLISWKKWCFEIFRTTAPSRASDPCITLICLLQYLWFIQPNLKSVLSCSCHYSNSLTYCNISGLPQPNLNTFLCLFLHVWALGDLSANLYNLHSYKLPS